MSPIIIARGQWCYQSTNKGTQYRWNQSWKKYLKKSTRLRKLNENTTVSSSLVLDMPCIVTHHTSSSNKSAKVTRSKNFHGTLLSMGPHTVLPASPGTTQPILCDFSGHKPARGEIQTHIRIRFGFHPLAHTQGTCYLLPGYSPIEGKPGKPIYEKNLAHLYLRKSLGHFLSFF